jgi:hypothetical protein
LTSLSVPPSMRRPSDSTPNSVVRACSPTMRAAFRVPPCRGLASDVVGAVDDAARRRHNGSRMTVSGAPATPAAGDRRAHIGSRARASGPSGASSTSRRPGVVSSHGEWFSKGG